MTTMRLVDGVTEIRLALGGHNYDSPYRCKTYDLGYPEPRVVSADAAGVSGVTDLTSLHGSRAVSLALMVCNDDTGSRHQHLDVLRTLCHPGRRPWLYAQCEGWAQERKLHLRASPLSCVVGPPAATSVEVGLSFIAPTGLFEALTPVVDGPVFPLTGATGLALTPGVVGSAALTLTPGGTTGGGSGGSLALALAPGSGNNVLTVTNIGSAPAAPTYVINGPCEAPQIRDRANGVRLAFSDYSIPSGRFVVIDVARRAVLLDGDPAQNLYNRVNWAVSRWFALSPGPTSLEFTTADGGGGGSLVVQHSPRFL